MVTQPMRAVAARPAGGAVGPRVWFGAHRFRTTYLISRTVRRRCKKSFSATARCQPLSSPDWCRGLESHGAPEEQTESCAYCAGYASNAERQRRPRASRLQLRTCECLQLAVQRTVHVSMGLVPLGRTRWLVADTQCRTRGCDQRDEPVCDDLEESCPVIGDR